MIVARIIAALLFLTGLGCLSQAQFNGCQAGFCSASGPSDPFWGSVVLLAGFDGANGATTYTAETGQVATIAGASSLSTTQVKFGTTSYACANTTTLTFPASSTWDLSAANSDAFTVEWWQYLPSTANTVNSILIGYNTNGYLMRTGDTTTMSLYWIDNASGSQSLLQAAAGFSANTWQAIAYEKNTSGAFNFYIAGTQVKTSTPANSTFKTTTTALNVGPCFAGGTGYMDELRITKGVARYNGNYTPATQPFPRHGWLLPANDNVLMQFSAVA